MAGPSRTSRASTPTRPSSGDHHRDPRAGPRRDAARRHGRPRPDQCPAAGAGGGPRKRPGIPFHVRGERFFARPEVRRALRVAATLDRPAALRRVAEGGAAAPAAAGAARRGVRARARGARADVPEGDAARERHAAVVTLLELAEDLVRTHPEADVAAFLSRGRAARRRRVGRRDHRGRAPDLSPRQGPRVGRGLPARARGRDAADPPGN